MTKGQTVSELKRQAKAAGIRGYSRMRKAELLAALGSVGITSEQEYLGGKVRLLGGDCTVALHALEDTSIDSCVCDPPYHLTSIVKRFGGKNAAPAKIGKSGAYARASAGFMGKQWDGGDIAFRPDVWAEVYRVLKPGGYLLAFSGTRTYHRMACAIEQAGFEVRDQIGWAYGSGFPKSHDAAKALREHAGSEDVALEWDGWGTALKPAWEPICVARKPLIGTVAENILVHRTGAINIDGCRVETDESLNGGAYASNGGRTAMPGDEREGAALGMFRAGKTAAKDFEQPKGRWPANICHDGSDDVLAAFPEAPGQQQTIDPSAPSPKTSNVYGAMKREGEASANRRYAEEGATNFAALPGARRNDSGSAARFFYTAKADAEDRLGSKHPTVKPLDLMQWLVRLVTPKGGVVLDCFAGTGTTGEAAWREGMRAVLIEREAEYQADIARRMELADNPTKRTAVAVTKNNLVAPESLPLFGGAEA